MQASLQAALESAQNIHTQLQHRMQQVKNEEPPHSSSQRAKNPQIRLDATLWDGRPGRGIDFKVGDSVIFFAASRSQPELVAISEGAVAHLYIPQKPPDASALARFGLASPIAESAVEDRIAHIRTSLLPPFTADPLPASDSEREPDPIRPQALSRLPQPSSRTQGPARGYDRGARSTLVSKPLAVPARQVRVAEAPKPTRVPSGAQRAYDLANAKSRRLSRRASAARTRRSTMFGRGEDAEILRVRSFHPGHLRYRYLGIELVAAHRSCILCKIAPIPRTRRRFMRTPELRSLEPQPKPRSREAFYSPV